VGLARSSEFHGSGFLLGAGVFFAGRAVEAGVVFLDFAVSAAAIAVLVVSVVTFKVEPFPVSTDF
jgi:hypothetical protein